MGKQFGQMYSGDNRLEKSITPIPETQPVNRAARRLKDESLVKWAYSLPKIDLHRHLEGSLRLQTLAEIAQEHGLDLPSYDVEHLRPYVQVTNDPPDHRVFLEKFRFMHRFYTSRETLQRVVREAIIDAALDNIHYLELRFNPYAQANVYGFPMADVVEWVLESTAQAQTETGTRTCLIITLPREKSLKIAQEMVEIAISYYGPLLRGIDLVGDEASFPAEKFIEPIQRARQAGLNVTIHAGEWANSNSVYTALKYLDAERIGHGIRAIEDSSVVQMLRERQVTLEVCPTSNVQTGVIPALTQHPLPDLYNLRIPVTLNTDDPSVSTTTLSDEYVSAIEGIGMKKHQLYRMLGYAVSAAFIPPEEKPQLRQLFRTALTAFPGALEAFDAATGDGGL